MIDPSTFDTENELLTRLRARQEQAFEELVEKFAPRMLTAAKNLLHSDQDAEDCVQEAFVAAFQKIDSFDGRSKIGTWLHSIMINKCLMKLRSKRRRPEVAIEQLLPRFRDDGHATEPQSPWTERAAHVGLDEETKCLVREKIEELPEQYRVVLLLRDVQHLSAQEAAEVLGDTPNAVKVRLHRARQALKALLDPHFVSQSGGNSL